MICPRCSVELEKSNYNDAVICYTCPHCNGQMLTMGGLRTLGVEPGNAFAIWDAALKGKLGSSLNCPECGSAMNSVKIDNGDCVFYVDICIRCHAIWFDIGELEKLPFQAVHTPPVQPLAAKNNAVNYSVGDIDHDRPTSSSGLLGHLGIDQQWCSLALRIALRLIFKI